MEKTEIFKGAFLGLAVGDAMGYTVDRKTLREICEDYGPYGLQGYDLVNGYADVSSYTQMAAFAANGLLLGLTRERMQGRRAPLIRYLHLALKEWSRSQHYCEPEKNHCWLSTLPELKRRRCMDTRMLDMLSRDTVGSLENPVNRFDDPCALTAVFPIALLAAVTELPQPELDRLGAETVALTHGDPDAFLSGAVLTHVLSLLATRPDMDREELLQDTIDAVQLQFGREYAETTHLWELLQMTKMLISSETVGPMEAMEQLRCRTAPEVLAGALYACVTCHRDFDTAIITAVNHSGRSAAVGAITGILMGMRMGAEALPEFYLENLEPAQILEELAADMVQGCPMDMGGPLFDDDWDRKYLRGGM